MPKRIKDETSEKPSRVLLGQVGVDAGMLMVGDPCYFVGKDATINERCATWEQACTDVFTKAPLPGRDAPMDVYDLGIAIATTYGDGCFPVYLETNEKGRRRLVVNLD
jgi:hypothetical protein